MSAPIDQIVIERRFCGPPDSGNGGYVCGRLAHYVGTEATVRLMRPPPLDTPLEVHESEGAIELRDGDAVIARAWPESRTVEAPPAPSLQAAQNLRTSYAGHQEHAFPTCFVCGTERREGDGLHIFPGDHATAEHLHQVACDWTPFPDLCEESGVVQPQFIWAALDCPSGWAFLSYEESVGVLGEFSVQVSKPLHCDRTYVVAGWEIGREGRKRSTASALYSADGVVLATAKATWIVIAASRASP